LNEVDGFCEFEIINLYLEDKKIDSNGDWVATDEFYLTYFDGQCFTLRNWDCERYDEPELFRFANTPYKITNLGSVFSPENQQKYPELYKQALKIINQEN
jgi:hypothetical protein